MVAGAGNAGMTDATTAGVITVAGLSWVISGVTATGATGIWWLRPEFSGSSDSSSRTRRISYAGVSKYLFGTRTTWA